MPSAQFEDELDSVFSALSHRTRRSILNQLELRSATVMELAEPHAMSVPAVSKHIKILEGAGLVRREIDGRVHHCSLCPAPLQDAEDWLAKRRSFWAQSLDQLAAYLESSDNAD